MLDQYAPELIAAAVVLLTVPPFAYWLAKPIPAK
jgi:hypothetical protein